MNTNGVVWGGRRGGGLVGGGGYRRLWTMEER